MAGSSTRSTIRIDPTATDAVETPVSEAESPLAACGHCITEADTLEKHEQGYYSLLGWAKKDGEATDERLIKLIILSAVHRSGSTLLQRICNGAGGR